MRELEPALLMMAGMKLGSIILQDDVFLKTG